MRDFPLSASQISNAAGVTFSEAQVACYMASVSDKPISGLAGTAGLLRDEARRKAYQWGVIFPDYDPFSKPKKLEWRKAKNGWELYDNKVVIGECVREVDGKYCAKTYSKTSFSNWNRRRAMLALSVELDAQSPDIQGFDGRPVRVVEVTDAGLVVDVIYPTDEEKVSRCRDALQFRTMMLSA